MEIVILDMRVEIAMNKCTVWKATIRMGHDWSGMGCGGGSGAWGTQKEVESGVWEYRNQLKTGGVKGWGNV